MIDSNASNRLLLVEDDARLANSTREYLENNGYSVAVEYRGDTAVRRILRDKPDLVILDLMLPGLDGLEVCRRVRPLFASPILMLTARDESMEQIEGLEIGADDYVVKPVVPSVLLARIRALLRHDRRIIDAAKGPELATTSVGELHLDYNNRIVTWRSVPVGCTEVEFELLWLFATNAGQILSRDFIFRSLHGYDYDGLDRSIDIRVSRLRKIFEPDLVNPTRIKTVRGKGYVLVESAWQQ
ncbi:response regulator [Granulosicoccus sp. 3-233]|uniref:response regulator n=1 Tax=Granulosicoccus sp. 3-233 TaxID=3417969 RepID=UPI003D325755